MSTIVGKIIQLSPSKNKDKRKIYEWLAHSDITPSTHGPVPTWEEFGEEYPSFFFDSSRPKEGMCFLIYYKDKLVGQINYHYHKESTWTELDIWMTSENQCSKGYGSDALEALCQYLHREFGTNQFVIRPSAKNLRAIAAYQKAGFELVNLSLQEQKERYGTPDCHDAVVMIRAFDEIKI